MEDSKEDRKMRGSSELPSELLNGYDQNADSDMDSEVEAEGVSDGNEEPIGNWHRGHTCYALAKNVAVLCPYRRNLWNFALKI